MSKWENIHWPKKSLEKTREIDNEARISRKAEMKRKFNRNQKWITHCDIQLSSLTSLLTSTPITEQLHSSTSSDFFHKTYSLRKRNKAVEYLAKRFRFSFSLKVQAGDKKSTMTRK